MPVFPFDNAVVGVNVFTVMRDILWECRRRAEVLWVLMDAVNALTKLEVESLSEVLAVGSLRCQALI